MREALEVARDDARTPMSRHEENFPLWWKNITILQNLLCPLFAQRISSPVSADFRADSSLPNFFGGLGRALRGIDQGLGRGF